MKSSSSTKKTTQTKIPKIIRKSAVQRFPRGNVHKAATKAANHAYDVLNQSALGQMEVYITNCKNIQNMLFQLCWLYNTMGKKAVSDIILDPRLNIHDENAGGFEGDPVHLISEPRTFVPKLSALIQKLDVLRKKTSPYSELQLRYIYNALKKSEEYEKARKKDLQIKEKLDHLFSDYKTYSNLRKTVNFIRSITTELDRQCPGLISLFLDLNIQDCILFDCEVAHLNLNLPANASLPYRRVKTIFILSLFMPCNDLPQFPSMINLTERERIIMQVLGTKFMSYISSQGFILPTKVEEQILGGMQNYTAFPQNSVTNSKQVQLKKSATTTSKRGLTSTRRPTLYK